MPAFCVQYFSCYNQFNYSAVEVNFVLAILTGALLNSNLLSLFQDGKYRVEYLIAHHITSPCSPKAMCLDNTDHGKQSFDEIQLIHSKQLYLVSSRVSSSVHCSTDVHQSWSIHYRRDSPIAASVDCLSGGYGVHRSEGACCTMGDSDVK